MKIKGTCPSLGKQTTLLDAESGAADLLLVLCWSTLIGWAHFSAPIWTNQNYHIVPNYFKNPTVQNR